MQTKHCNTVLFMVFMLGPQHLSSGLRETLRCPRGVKDAGRAGVEEAAISRGWTEAWFGASTGCLGGLGGKVGGQPACHASGLGFRLRVPGSFQKFFGRAT